MGLVGDGFDLEGRVTDVEVLGHALAQLVEDRAHTTGSEGLVGDGDVGGEAGHATGDGPGVQVVEIDDAVDVEQVVLDGVEVEAGRGDLEQDDGGVTEQVDLSRFQLPVLLASAQEAQAHDMVLADLDKASKGRTLWRALPSV